MRLVSRGNWQPRLSFRKARIRAPIPLHRSTFAIPAFLSGPPRPSYWILHFFLAGRRRGLHADLFSVIHDGGSTQREIKCRHHLCDLVVMLPVAVTVVGAHNVVVADHKSRPSRGSIYGGNLF